MLETLYKEALDRKKNPKEGSYTNYLFDKGLDKILKKVGEEATEVVIGAKNADKEEIANETADVLYHLAVMLVETGVSPEDIEAVLKARRGKQSNVHDRKEVTDYSYGRIRHGENSASHLELLRQDRNRGTGKVPPGIRR